MTHTLFDCYFIHKDIIAYIFIDWQCKHVVMWDETPRYMFVYYSKYRALTSGGLRMFRLVKYVEPRYGNYVPNKYFTLENWR